MKMDKKTGILALGTLIGAGLLSSKKFKREMGAETFMAQGKRVNAIRANRINLKPIGDESNSVKWRKKVYEFVYDVSNKNNGMSFHHMMDDANYQAWTNLTGERNQLATEKYTQLLLSLRNYWTQEMSKKYKSLYDSISAEYEGELELLRQAIEPTLKNYHPHNPNGAYLSQVTIEDYLKSHPNVEQRLEAIKDFMVKTQIKFGQNRGGAVGLPILGQYTSSTTTARDWENMTPIQVAKAIGMRSRYAGDYLDNDLEIHLSSLISAIRGKAHLNEANPLLESDIISNRKSFFVDFSMTEIEFIKDMLVSTMNVAGYASILDYVNFFKANPSIKSVGVTPKGEQKYYDVEFDNYNSPKGLSGYAKVWDNSLWSSEFNQNEFNLLEQDGMDKLDTVLKSEIAERARLARRKQRLVDSVEEQTKEALLNGIEVLMESYGNAGQNPSYKQRIGDIYLSLIGMQTNRYSFNVDVDEYQTVTGYGDANATIETTNRIFINNQLVESLIGKDKQFKSKILAKIPQNVKSEIKKDYETRMEYSIQSQKNKIESLKQALKETEDRFQREKALF